MGSSSGQKNASWGVVAGTQNASWGVVAGDATTTTTTGTSSTTNGAAAAFGKNMLRTTNLATSRLRGMGGFGASRRASAEHLRSTLIQNKNSNNNMKDISTKSAPPITYNSNSNNNNNNMTVNAGAVMSMAGAPTAENTNSGGFDDHQQQVGPPANTANNTNNAVDNGGRIMDQHQHQHQHQHNNERMSFG